MKRNELFKHKHLGEECYIFGNGYSLRHFDLKCFKDKISFGCNVLRVHKDFDSLNLKYYVNAAPFLYSPIWRGNRATIEFNPYYALQKSFVNTGYIHFVHASNFIFVKNKDEYRFIHNLDKHTLNIKFNDITKSSSFFHGALYSMIGLAIYMGFKKAYLVGCDYFFEPLINGHFWDQEEPRYNITSFNPSELMSVIDNSIDITCITIKNVGSKINDIQYEDMFNLKETYKNSNELVSKKI